MWRGRTFSDSSLYFKRLASNSRAAGDGWARRDMRFIAVILNTTLRTTQGKPSTISCFCVIVSEYDDSHLLLASNFFWMCGNRSVGPPVGLVGSGTKCGRSSDSHLCCSICAAVGREVGSMVRHSATKSFAVSDTFAQYSAEMSGS